MKTANVLEVRTVRAPANLDPAYTQPARRDRIDKLLQAYPDVSTAETAEIVDFLAYGMHMDVGLLAARDEFKEKVAAIRSAYPDAFRIQLAHLVLFLLIILIPLAFCAFLPTLLGTS